MRLVLFAVLFTLVYSWEEFVDLLLRWIRILTRNQHEHNHSLSGDHFVTNALFFAAIPISLLYFLASDASIEFKLKMMAAQMLIIALGTLAPRVFFRRMQGMNKYQGLEKVGVVIDSLLGLMSPAIRLLHKRARADELVIAKFAFFLSLPALAGLVLAHISPRDVMDGEILPNMSSLIAVLVGSIMIFVTVNFLERHFRLNAFKFLSYARILLGLAIIIIISEGLV